MDHKPAPGRVVCKSIAGGVASESIPGRVEARILEIINEDRIVDQALDPERPALDSDRKTNLCRVINGEAIQGCAEFPLSLGLHLQGVSGNRAGNH